MSRQVFHLKRKKNSAVRLNPAHHFPKSKRGRPKKKGTLGRPRKQAPREKVFPQGRGRPRKIVSWTLELFNNKNEFIEALVGQGTKQAATVEAKNFVGKRYKGHTINRVILDGPHPL